MTEDQFVNSRQSGWAEFERLLALARVRGGRHPGLALFPVRYRTICQDLNQARACSYSAGVIEQLNHLVWEGHQVLHRRGGTAGRSLAAVLFQEFPRRVREEWRAVAVGHLLFYGLAFVVFGYLLSNPDKVGLFISEGQRDDLAAMYDPGAEHFLQPRDTSGSADMFGFYIFNNIGIGLRGFAAGALAGIGSVVVLCVNAVILSASAAWVLQLGYGQTFFPFVATHGAFELTALVLFSVAGLRVGWAFVAPGRLSRPAAFARAAGNMVPLVAGAILFMAVAAGIEAFWSSQILPAGVKYLSAAGCWSLVAVFLVLGGRRRA